MTRWLCIRGCPSVSNAAMMLRGSMVYSDRAVLSSVIPMLYWLFCECKGCKHQQCIASLRDMGQRCV